MTLKVGYTFSNILLCIKYEQDKYRLTFQMNIQLALKSGKLCAYSPFLCVTILCRSIADISNMQKTFVICSLTFIRDGNDAPMNANQLNVVFPNFHSLDCVDLLIRNFSIFQKYSKDPTTVQINQRVMKKVKQQSQKH